MLYLLSLFSDFFTYDIPSISCPNSYKSISTGDFYIFQCQFISLSSSSNGGAIYGNLGDLRALIEFCMFYNCHTTGNYMGGSVYLISSTSGGLVLNRICTRQCNCNNAHYQSIYLQTHQSLESRCFFVSVTESTSSTKAHPFYLVNGHQKVTSTNSSYHSTAGGTAISFYEPNTASGKFCNIFKTGFSGRSLHFAHSGGLDICEFLYSNLVNNTIGKDTSCNVVYSNLKTTLSYCIFKNNYARTQVICYSGTFSITYCQFDTYSYEGTAPVLSNIITGDVYTQLLTHFYTHHCDSPYEIRNTKAFSLWRPGVFLLTLFMQSLQK